MPPQSIRVHKLANGLTLLLERMTGVRSAAFSLLVPAGAVYDPSSEAGCASVLADLLTRGAGDLDSVGLTEALDNLGLQRGESAERSHISLGGATIAEYLPQALEIYGDIIRRPHLPEEEFESAVMGAQQALMAIDDEPRQKVMLELRRRCYPAPWGLPPEGNPTGLENLRYATVQKHYQTCFRANDSILGIAGDIDPEQMIEVVERVFGDWEQKPAPEIKSGPRGVFRDHIPHESTQTQIGVAYDSVPYRDPEYYAAWAAVGVLSGGSSSRLFTEVREKRGLCYSVYAALTGSRHLGRVLCYAGTTVERAQETLDVLLQEVIRLPQGIQEDELTRCLAQAKSTLIMQQESSSNRATSLVTDWYHLGRVNPLDSVREKIEQLTVCGILDHLEKHPPKDFTILTLGPSPLEVPNVVS